MKPAKEIRVGNIIMVDEKPFIVLRSDVNGSSRTGFTYKWKMKNLLTNAPLENVFRGDDKFDVVVPSVSVLAENPVALVEKVTARKGTKEVARAYLEFLFSDEGQRIGVKHHLRPYKPELAKGASFPRLSLVTIAELGGWPALQKKHFADGGVFDQIYDKK